MDPTEIAITVTFIAALGIFVLAVVIRRLAFLAAGPSREQIKHEDPTAYQEGVPSASLPPELPVGRVATWLYGPVDLLGLGLIFLIFSSLVLSSLKMTGDLDVSPKPSALLFSIGFQFVIAGIAAIFVASRIRLVEWLGLRWAGWRWVFLIAPATVVTMWTFFGFLQATGFMDWIESLGVEAVQDTVKLLQESKDPWVIGLMVFAAVVAAPLCEEVVFRGYFYPAAKKFAGPWVAMVCSALVFAAAHASLAALLPLFVFGCVLVLLYEKTGSLWAPVAVHFCFNGATVLFQLAARYYNIPLDPP